MEKRKNSDVAYDIMDSDSIGDQIAEMSDFIRGEAEEAEKLRKWHDENDEDDDD